MKTFREHIIESEILDRNRKTSSKNLWKEVESFVSTHKNSFIHTSSREHEEGETIKSYRSDKKIKSIYSKSSAGEVQFIRDLERSFEELRPSSKVSRQNCVYAFRDVATAKEWQKNFKDRYVYVVEAAAKYSVHDMNIIDLYEKTYFANMIELEYYGYEDGVTKTDIRNKKKELDATLTKMIKSYWAGKPADSQSPVFEVLIESSAKILKRFKVS